MCSWNDCGGRERQLCNSLPLNGYLAARSTTPLRQAGRLHGGILHHPLARASPLRTRVQASAVAQVWVRASLLALRADTARCARNELPTRQKVSVVLGLVHLSARSSWALFPVSPDSDGSR